MRVVQDTNVFITSFLGKGRPGKIIDLWKEGKISICLSKDIVDEYIQVVEKLSLGAAKEVKEILYLFARNFHTFFTAKTPNIKIVASDPDDNKFFECAVALNAEYIISGDKAVVRIEEYLGIKVFSPKQFLNDFVDMALLI